VKFACDILSSLACPALLYRVIKKDGFKEPVPVVGGMA